MNGAELLMLQNSLNFIEKHLQDSSFTKIICLSVDFKNIDILNRQVSYILSDIINVDKIRRKSGPFIQISKLISQDIKINYDELSFYINKLKDILLLFKNNENIVNCYSSLSKKFKISGKHSLLEFYELLKQFLIIIDQERGDYKSTIFDNFLFYSKVLQNKICVFITAINFREVLEATIKQIENICKNNFSFKFCKLYSFLD